MKMIINVTPQMAVVGLPSYFLCCLSEMEEIVGLRAVLSSIEFSFYYESFIFEKYNNVN